MNGDDPVAVANYIDWRDQSRSFSAMGAADYWSPNLTGIDSPEHIYGSEGDAESLPHARSRADAWGVCLSKAKIKTERTAKSS